MPEPTPSQLKIDGIVATKLLTTPSEFTAQDIEDFKRWFHSILNEYEYSFNGNIGPINPAAESFMVSVVRKDFEELKRERDGFFELSKSLDEINKSNDAAFKDLAEQLRVTQRSLDMYKHSLEETQKESREQIFNLTQENKALELRLRVKDSPIKAGLKRFWKWFKSTVGQ